MNTKVPRIRIEMSLDGKVTDATVLADSVADRDRALARLRTVLPIFELVSGAADGHAANLQSVIADALLRWATDKEN